MRKIEPGMKIAAMKAAAKLPAVRVVIEPGSEDNFWVGGYGQLNVNAMVCLTREEVEAEYPERPGGGPERRWDERRDRDRRQDYGGDRSLGRGGNDARSGGERRCTERRAETENGKSWFRAFSSRMHRRHFSPKVAEGEG